MSARCVCKDRLMNERSSAFYWCFAGKKCNNPYIASGRVLEKQLGGRAGVLREVLGECMRRYSVCMREWVETVGVIL